MNSWQKVAIITGAGRGLGALIAQQLAAAGVRVAVNDLNPDRAEQTAVAIQAAGGQALPIAADVSNKFQCVHLIETTRAAWGQLDILVNNAAVVRQSSILKLDEWDWSRMMDVNVKSVFFMSQLCGRVMAEENQTRGGLIFNIASTAGVEEAWEGRAAYCASKAALVGFTRECAREFATYGLRVYALPLPEALTASQMTAVAREISHLGSQTPDTAVAWPPTPILHIPL